MFTTTSQYLEILSPCHCSITSYFHSADKYLQLVFGSCLQKYSRCKMSSISSLKTECLSVCHSHSLILVWKVSLSLLLCSNFSLSLALALSLARSVSPYCLLCFSRCYQHMHFLQFCDIVSFAPFKVYFSPHLQKS